MRALIYITPPFCLFVSVLAGLMFIKYGEDKDALVCAAFAALFRLWRDLAK